jgi:hypothetical protein
MTTKRSILVSENERMIFRFDVNKTNNLPEYDMFKALMDMDKAGIINTKKLTNMLKVHYGLGIVDRVSVITDIASGNGEQWRILPEGTEV